MKNMKLLTLALLFLSTFSEAFELGSLNIGAQTDESLSLEANSDDGDRVKCNWGGPYFTYTCTNGEATVNESISYAGECIRRYKSGIESATSAFKRRTTYRSKSLSFEKILDPAGHFLLLNGGGRTPSINDGLYSVQIQDFAQVAADAIAQKRYSLNFISTVTVSLPEGPGLVHENMKCVADIKKDDSEFLLMILDQI